jgi:hypothetical protein
MRLKMNLLHYLYKLPDNIGLSSASPYHNFDIVCKMLSLPSERLHERTWVKDYFKKIGLYYSNRSFYGDTRNTLNRQMFGVSKYLELDPQLWQNTPINPEDVNDINKFFRNYSKPIEKLKHYLTSQRVVKELVKVVGLRNRFNSNLSAYQTLKSIELSLLKNNFK